MALTVSKGFDIFLERLTPHASQRTASAKHRKSVEDSIKKVLTINCFRETGSFSHGTGVRNHCDVDLMVSISNSQPTSSDTALNWIKNALTSSFPSTTVRVSRPAVVVEFAGGLETWEIIPAFITGKGGPDVFIYEIPGAPSGWIEAAPVEHINYVNEINSAEGAIGGAKKLARLAKAWKYYCNVPISSFYLEMRAAQYMATQTSFVPIYDVRGFFVKLEATGLAAMNDPKQAASRFSSCSSEPKLTESISKTKTASARAEKALSCYQKDDFSDTFYYLDLLFGGKFPPRL